ncbi:MAG TPA: Mth938-like domain-containing protein [Allosphingosinicella sp.]
MPRFNPAEAATGPLVRGFAADGAFVVEGQGHKAILLTPERALAWTPPPLSALAPEHLAEVLDLRPGPEFLLLGTGSRLERPSAAFTRALESRGIGVEPMDSRAAARTWGVLRAEERWIVAALLPL